MRRILPLPFAKTPASLTLPPIVTPQSSKIKDKPPPKTWVDKDTGHRVFRVTDEPGSIILYFNFDAYTPDNRQMVYKSPAGIHMLDLTSWQTRLLVPSFAAQDRATQNKPSLTQRILAVGRKTGAVYFSRTSPDGISTLFSANVTSGAVRKLITLPPHAAAVTINADETLAAGTFVETVDRCDGNQTNSAQVASDAPTSNAANFKRDSCDSPVPPEGKGQMMARRLAARLPMVLFVVNIHTGKFTELLHSTNWINHLLFSPVDPTLLMYCHEGPWQLVDRIWLIRTNGSQNTLVHKRTMFMEITGHEFWSRDGEFIWYDWQFPKGDVYFLAGFNVLTHERVAYRMQANEWSIHFNGSNDPTVFAGDGGDSGQVTRAPDGTWIELYHADTPDRRDGINSPDFIQPGVLRSERLVNMTYHNYKFEPDVRFSPDDRFVFFTSNMFGPRYVFAVEVAKAQNPLAEEMLSTPGLAQNFIPRPPPTPYDEQW